MSAEYDTLYTQYYNLKRDKLDVYTLNNKLMKLYFDFAIWLEKMKDMTNESDVLLYCQGLYAFNIIHCELPITAINEENTQILHKLLAEQNSFALNFIGTKSSFILENAFYDMAILKNNPYSHFNKWIYNEKSLYHLIKSAELKLSGAMIHLIDIYTDVKTYNFNLAVELYLQLKKYYIDNNICIDFSKYKVSDETWRILRAHVDSIEYEYELV